MQNSESLEFEISDWALSLRFVILDNYQFNKLLAHLMLPQHGFFLAVRYE